ncbi:MAG: DUF433 domain-containing protein [Anaerolineales bacterium]|nr:DUF433 domain-containing protein [Anaerolineales bacterium]
MTAASTRYEHIQLDANKIPIIAGTTMKVVELVLNQKAYGWSPEELHFQHPYLSMEQIYSALAYYWDYQEAFEEDIKRRLEQVNQIEQTVSLTTLKAKLKAMG